MSEYIEAKKREKTAGSGRSPAVSNQKKITNDELRDVVNEKSKKSEEKKEKSKKNLFQLKKRLEQLEKEIESAENQKSKIENAMNGEEFIKYPVKAKTISAEYDAVSKKLNELMEEWGRVSEEIES
ncbi:MAG: hypothetical protein HYV29_14150 [Ignavibacteriales bacterium]|nr:hypothetical protein [Ignavibacteriales bacterium]